MAQMKRPFCLMIVLCITYSFCAYLMRQISLNSLNQTSPALFEWSVPVKDDGKLTSPNVSPSTRRTTPQGGTTCSKNASLYGRHQKIITYSIYGVTQKYWRGLPEILVQAKMLYPGWFVRVYTDSPDYEPLRVLLRNNSNLQVCDINNLPPPWVSLMEYPSMLWRYFPLGDAQVDVVLFRDSDSQILNRERDAVGEWLQSNKSLHVMRDHPFHGVPILGGMWGARILPSNRDKWKQQRDLMFEQAIHHTEKRDFDQKLLSQGVWPAFDKDYMAHDSYTCNTFTGSIPFPTRRNGSAFIGSQYYVYLGYGKLYECPLQCRPARHQDWIHC